VKGKFFDAVNIYKLLLQELVKDACHHWTAKHHYYKDVDRTRVCFVFSLPNDKTDPKTKVLETASLQVRIGIAFFFQTFQKLINVQSAYNF
jgi:hypothetical protein